MKTWDKKVGSERLWETVEVRALRGHCGSDPAGVLACAAASGKRQARVSDRPVQQFGSARASSRLWLRSKGIEESGRESGQEGSRNDSGGPSGERALRK